MIEGSCAVLSLIATIQQTDPQLVSEIERLGSALWMLAISAVIVGTLSLAALVASLWMMFSASRLINNVQKQVERLAPRTEPLIEKVTALATDARDTTDSVRRGVTDLMDTVNDINGSLRSAAEAAETRVREFSAVVDIVKHELEEALMDTAATARGIQATSRALRGEPGPPAREQEPEGLTHPEQLALLEAGELEDSAPVRRARATAVPARPRADAHARTRGEDGGEAR
jgi:uncharacterized protein YoxC